MANKLSKRTQELISEGLKTCGFASFEDPYYYIEERLYTTEAKEVFEFLKWLWLINRPYGPANAQQRWKEFKSGEQPPKEFFTLQYGWDTPRVKFSQRMKEPTIDRIAKYKMNCNWELNYWFKIVDQDNKLVAEFTKDEVYKKAMELKAAGVEPTGEWERIQTGLI